MSNLKRLQFETTIKAPVSLVWGLMFGAESYPRWTAAFAEGSYFDGSWSQGDRIKFLSPSGDGMLAEIAENRPYEFISIRHIGHILNGVEDTESASVRAWAPAFENYTFITVPEGTKVIVDQDVAAGFEQCMKDTWPKAFELLRQLCEDQGAT